MLFPYVLGGGGGAVCPKFTDAKTSFLMRDLTNFGGTNYEMLHCFKDATKIA